MWGRGQLRDESERSEVLSCGEAWPTLCICLWMNTSWCPHTRRVKYLLYTHQLMRPLAWTVYRATYEVVLKLLSAGRRFPRWSAPAQRRLHLVAMFSALLAQIILVWIVHGLVGLVISVIELYALLAEKHLEITL